MNKILEIYKIFKIIIAIKYRIHIFNNNKKKIDVI